MMDPGSIKITVRLESRPDGGLRAWSDELPGLTLSNRDRKAVIDDLAPALEEIVSDMLGYRVRVGSLRSLG